jgi:hypothetical protein
MSNKNYVQPLCPITYRFFGILFMKNLQKISIKTELNTNKKE